MQAIVLKEIELPGTIADVNDHRVTIKLVQEGDIVLQSFITAKTPLDRLVEDGFDALIHHNDNAVKLLVHPWGPDQRATRSFG